MSHASQSLRLKAASSINGGAKVLTIKFLLSSKSQPSDIWKIHLHGRITHSMEDMFMTSISMYSLIH